MSNNISTLTTIFTLKCTDNNHHNNTVGTIKKPQDELYYKQPVCKTWSILVYKRCTGSYTQTKHHQGNIHDTKIMQ